jgi:hypothetical protein
MTDELWWQVIRGSGLVAWTLLAADVLVGLAMSTGWVPVRRARPVHAWIGGLAMGALGLHLVSLAADNYLTFTLTDLLVPFASDWSPGAVAWGVGALYLVVAVEVSSLLRAHLPVRWWRAVHSASFVAFWLATMHAVSAGTDVSVPLVASTVVATIVAVLGLLLVRIWQGAVPGARVALARRRAAAERPVALAALSSPDDERVRSDPPGLGGPGPDGQPRRPRHLGRRIVPVAGDSSRPREAGVVVVGRDHRAPGGSRRSAVRPFGGH